MAGTRLATRGQHLVAWSGLVVGLGVVGLSHLAATLFPEQWGGPNIGGGILVDLAWLVALAGAGFLALFYGSLTAIRVRRRRSGEPSRSNAHHPSA